MDVKRSLLSINYRSGRRSAYPVDMIVIHVTEGNADAVRSWFNDPDADVSAHYMVRTDGVIEQFVNEADTAYGNGRVHDPTAELVIERSPANPNGYTISIEHEGDGMHELTDAQRAASIALIRDICQRRSIPINRRHIVGHHEIYSLKPCPGAISVDRLVSEVASETAESARPIADIPGIDYPPLVYSNMLRDWLVVTRYAADDDWDFVPLKTIKTGQRAGSRLSVMPVSPPKEPS